MGVIPWSLSFKKEYMLRVYENGLVKKIHVCLREEVTGD